MKFVALDSPFLDLSSRVGEIAKDVLVQALVAKPRVEQFDEGVLVWLAWRDAVMLDLRALNPAEMEVDANSGPLSLLIREGLFGRPSMDRATSALEIECAAKMPTASLVKSSMIVRHLSFLFVSSQSNTKSITPRRWPRWPRNLGHDPSEMLATMVRNTQESITTSLRYARQTNENALVESFNSRLRDECLNAEFPPTGSTRFPHWEPLWSILVSHETFSLINEEEDRRMARRV